MSTTPQDTDFLHSLNINDKERLERARTFHTLTQHNPIIHNCITLWQQGMLVSFEDTLMYCVQQLVDAYDKLFNEHVQLIEDVQPEAITPETLEFSKWVQNQHGMILTHKQVLVAQALFAMDIGDGKSTILNLLADYDKSPRSSKGKLL